MDQVIRSELQQAELYFKQAISDDSNVQKLEEVWIPLLGRVAAAVESGWLSDDTIHLHLRLAKRIEVMARAFKQQDKEMRAIQVEALAEARQLLVTGDASIFATASTSSSSPDDDLTSFAPYRHFFLSNFHNPYPSPTDKSHLLTLVPHTPAQLSTWFVNARRRSGWQSLFQQYGSAKFDRFLAFLKLVDSDPGLAGWQITEEARERVKDVRRYFEEGGRDRVGDVVGDVLEREGVVGVQSRREDLQVGERTTARRRTVKRVSSSSESDEDDDADSMYDSPPPRPKARKISHSHATPPSSYFTPPRSSFSPDTPPSSVNSYSESPTPLSIYVPPAMGEMEMVEPFTPNTSRVIGELLAQATAAEKQQGGARGRRGRVVI